MKQIYLIPCAIIILLLYGCSVKTEKIEHYVFEGNRNWHDFKLPMLEPRNAEIGESLSSFLDSAITCNSKDDYIPTNYLLEFETANHETSFFVQDCSFNLLCDNSMGLDGVYVFEKYGIQMLLFTKNREKASKDKIFKETRRKVRFDVSNYPLRKSVSIMYFHSPKQLYSSIKNGKIVVDSIKRRL